METKLNSTEKVIACLIVIVIVVVSWLIGAWLFQMLWNYLGRELFTFMPQIEYWHSIAVIVFLYWVGSFIRRK